MTVERRSLRARLFERCTQAANARVSDSRQTRRRNGSQCGAYDIGIAISMLVVRPRIALMRVG